MKTYLEEQNIEPHLPRESHHQLCTLLNAKKNNTLKTEITLKTTNDSKITNYNKDLLIKILKAMSLKFFTT